MRQNGRLLHLSPNVNENDYYVSAGNIWHFFGIDIVFRIILEFPGSSEATIRHTCTELSLVTLFSFCAPQAFAHTRFFVVPIHWNSSDDIAKQPPPEPLTGIQTWSRLILIELWD